MPAFKPHHAAALVASLLLGIVLAMSTLAFANSTASSGEATRDDLGPSLHALPLSSSLAAFEGTRHPGDNLPPGLAHAVEHAFTETAENVPAELLPGEQLIGESRRLIANLGGARRSFFAWPTDKGRVCYLLTEMMGGCTEVLTVKQPVGTSFGDPDSLGRGAPGMVAGLVPNEVTSVDVVVGGVSHSARLRRNAYFYELDASVRSPDAVVAHFRDGSSQTIQIPTP